MTLIHNFFGSGHFFPSQTTFQCVPVMQIRWRQREVHFSHFARIWLFTVFVYNRKLWKFPSMPWAFTTRYRSPQVPMKSFAKLKSGFDGRRPLWSLKGSNNVCSSFNLASAFRRNKQGSIRLLEWSRSQLHEWHKNFIGNSERSFPTVFRAPIDLEWKSKLV